MANAETIVYTIVFYYLVIMKKKYSPGFERDFNWFLQVRSLFNFDGSNGYDDNCGNSRIIYDKNGVSGKEAFHQWDSKGKVVPTKHPNLLHTLFKTKGSINLHIKMYAEDRAKGLLPGIEFKELCKEINAPLWFSQAVEQQKFKHYDSILLGQI